VTKAPEEHSSGAFVVLGVMLEKHPIPLTRLSTSLESHAHLAIRTCLYTHLNRAELLARVDTLITQLDQTRTLAGLAREALLRPQKGKERPGFTD
jgi:hypothetical protein